MSAFRERIPKWAVLFSLSILFSATNVFAQAAPEAPKEKPAAVPQEKPAEAPNAAQIELLETKYRFEANGDSRKEVHALVKINSELGVRQFARLNFDYNRSFQSVEIPLVHITHASGGTADILPSAITDAPNPAVEKFPAYHDVRVKSVRILGLQPGDLLEYRVVTLTTHPPLAPDFWLSHTFDRTGVTSKQMLELDLPSSVAIQLAVSPDIPSAAVDDTTAGMEARHVYRWNIGMLPNAEFSSSQTDISFSTASSWDALAGKIELILKPQDSTVSDTWKKASELTAKIPDQAQKVRVIYDFVSRKIATVDLPVGATGFRTRTPADVLATGYATSEDKFRLFNSLTKYFGSGAVAALTGSIDRISDLPPCPSLFAELLIVAPIFTEGVSENYWTWVDPTLEVAPFGVIPAKLRGREALTGRLGMSESQFSIVPTSLPFASTQRVKTTSSLSASGTLTAKVSYELRGDNELLLRVTFHQTPTEKQKEIAQYLALSDGFRGKVTSVKTSDPYDTDKPFEVEYELTQEKFVDWSKQPVRIPVLLPLPGLPETPKKPAADAKIELGPPLEVDLRGTLRLPPGMTAQSPPGTSVKRDYASFTAEYSSKANVLRFSRRLNFVSQNIPGTRFVDFGAFLHAVQNDQAQLFVLEKSEPPASAKPK